MVSTDTGADGDRADTEAKRQVQWWAPRRRGWWIAVLFMIGSACFALGAFQPTATWLGSAVGWVFFIGSICFFLGAALLIPDMPPESQPEPSGSPA